MLTRDFIFEALYSPTSGYFGTKGSDVRACVASVMRSWLELELYIACSQLIRCVCVCLPHLSLSIEMRSLTMGTHLQVICSPPEDQRIAFKALKGYWDYQLELDKCVRGCLWVCVWVNNR